MKITKRNGTVHVYDDAKVARSILLANENTPAETITPAMASALADEVFARVTKKSTIITTADVRLRAAEGKRPAGNGQTLYRVQKSIKNSSRGKPPRRRCFHIVRWPETPERTQSVKIAKRYSDVSVFRASAQQGSLLLLCRGPAFLQNRMKDTASLRLHFPAHMKASSIRRSRRAQSERSQRRA